MKRFRMLLPAMLGALIVCAPGLVAHAEEAPAVAAEAAAVAEVPAEAPAVAAPAELDGEALFNQRTCFACHGKDAKTPILPEYPKLAGQSAVYALAQMKDIKSGVRANGSTAAMKGVMFLVSDAEMAAIAEYVSGLEP